MVGMSTRPLGPDPELADQLTRAGFYPHLIADLLDDELDGAPVQRHLLHLETHVERAEVHRHAIILVLTRESLVIVHVDDHQPEDHSEPIANVSVETVALPRLDSVVVSAVYPRPHEHRPGQGPRELTVGIAWSGGSRLDLGPAGCADPQCDADHGYQGQMVREDLVLRVSADADGTEHLNDARSFARELRRATRDAAWASAQGERPEHSGSAAPTAPRGVSRLVRGNHR